MSDPNQSNTPYEKGYMTGLSMGQGDSKTLGELDRMLANPNMDADLRRGIVAGRERANELMYANELEQILARRKHSNGM